MWLLANYCFLSINFIEIRFAYMLNPPILSVHVFSQMCAPILPSPWLRHKTSPSPKELLSCLFPALSFCYCISTGLISSGYRSFHIQWIWTFLLKFIKKLESPSSPAFSLPFFTCRTGIVTSAWEGYCVSNICVSADLETCRSACVYVGC